MYMETWFLDHLITSDYMFHELWIIENYWNEDTDT